MQLVKMLVLIGVLSSCGTRAPKPPIVCKCTYFDVDGVCYGYTTEEHPVACGEFSPAMMDKFACISNEDHEVVQNYIGELVEYIKLIEKENKRKRVRR